MPLNEGDGGNVTTTSRGFREPSYFVLASLLDRSRHGYGIIKQAAMLSGGHVRLAPGTLYGALDRLAAAGLIEPNGQEVVAGRPRHYYQLTDEGRVTLLGEARRLASAARAVLDHVMVDLSDEAVNADQPTNADQPIIADHPINLTVASPGAEPAVERADGYDVGGTRTRAEPGAATVNATQPSASSMLVFNGSAPKQP